jgi:hypothetical protein
MELPQPPPNRKPSSTTLRNATGERALPTWSPAPSRWRAPAIVGGVALVAAIGLLIALRGGGNSDRRGESDQSTAASPAPDEPRAAVPPPRVMLRKLAPEPAPTAVEPPPVARPVEDPPVAKRDELGPRKAGTRPARKGAGARAARAARSSGSAAPQEPATPAKADEPTTKSANDAPVINP